MKLRVGSDPSPSGRRPLELSTWSFQGCHAGVPGQFPSSSVVSLLKSRPLSPTRHRCCWQLLLCRLSTLTSCSAAPPASRQHAAGYKNAFKHVPVCPNHDGKWMPRGSALAFWVERCYKVPKAGWRYFPRLFFLSLRATVASAPHRLKTRGFFPSFVATRSSPAAFAFCTDHEEDCSKMQEEFGNRELAIAELQPTILARPCFKSPAGKGHICLASGC